MKDTFLVLGITRRIEFCCCGTSLRNSINYRPFFYQIFVEDMMMYLAIFCAMMTISIEAAPPRGDLCDDMMESVNSLCPSHEKVVYCPDSEQLRKSTYNFILLSRSLDLPYYPNIE